MARAAARHHNRPRNSNRKIRKVRSVRIAATRIHSRLFERLRTGLIDRRAEEGSTEE
jgi:hypothetical protein